MISKLSDKLDRFTRHLPGQLLSAAVLGALQVFAFAPFEQFWILYPSIVGFLLLLKQLQKSTRRYFLVCYTFCIAMFLATIHWVYVSMDLFGGMPSIVSMLLIVLLAGYLAIFPSTALWASTRFQHFSDSARYLLIIPVLWLIGDWLRGYLLTGFPWAYLGYSHAATPLAGFAPILGVQGITLAIMIICGALTLLIEKQQILLSTVLIGGLLITATLLQKQQYTQLQPAVLVTLVQGNIDQNEKWKQDQLYPSLLKYLDLSESKHPQQPELIIWPESAIAALEIDMQEFLQPLSNNLASANKTLISGIIGYNLATDEYYNSIISLGKLPAGQHYSLSSPNRYQKHQLLPIGEFVPFEDFLRPLAPYFNLPMSSFQRGEQIQPNLQSAESRLAAALCYEIAFSELLRKNIDEKTGLLLTLSNDAWFGHSIGPAQHLQIAQMRAIEFARPLLRSTNNGITAIFDSRGHELGRLPANTAAALTQKVQPAFGNTPYQTYGALPLYLYCLLILAGSVFYSLKTRDRQSNYSLKAK